MITKEELHKKYSPEYLAEDCLCFGDGWNQLIDEALNYIKDYDESNSKIYGKSPRLKIVYSKEKFASLRIHYMWENQDSWDDNAEYWSKKYTSILEFQEYRSKFICEETGRPGELCASGGKKQGWLKTLCREKAEELGYKIYKDCI